MHRREEGTGLRHDGQAQSVPDFGGDHVRRFLRQLESNPSTVEVIGFQEFPYSGGGKLEGSDREVEREYWLQLSEDAIR